MRATTQTRRGRATQYIAVGVPPALLDELLELIDAEDAALVKVDQDEEGSVRVCFHLAPGDQGSWLMDVTRRFGCGLVPAPKC